VGTLVLAIEHTLPVILPAHDVGLECIVAVLDAQLILEELSDKSDVFVVCALLIVDESDVNVDCES